MTMLDAILGVVDADDAERVVACDEDAERDTRDVVRTTWRASEAWGV
jgi:hypothetical protein